MMKGLASVVMTLAGFFLFAGIGYAQTAVSGVVTDESGEPLIGASVFVEGNATVGTITDLDGNYALTVPEGATARVTVPGENKSSDYTAGTHTVRRVFK